MPSIVGWYESLADVERKGWLNGAYHKSFDDNHLVLLCRKYAADLQAIDQSLVPEKPLAITGDSEQFESVEHSNNDNPFTNDDNDADFEAAERQAEQLNLFAKFTSTYKIWDFLRYEEKGESVVFPQNDVIEAALIFSDLSGFSKLCESYVEKYAGRDAQGRTDASAMSKASEKLNLVVNSVFELQIRLVDQFNGDVVNFAGDAMFVLFRADSLDIAAQRAAGCALAMLAGVAQRLKDMEAQGIDDLDTQLFIHIGVGAGMIRCMTYGGEFDKAEFVVAGPALTEAKDCGELAKCGEAIISSSVLKYSMPCEPKMTKLDKTRVASVDDLDSAEFYVLHALGKPPVLPPVTARQTMLDGTCLSLPRVSTLSIQVRVVVCSQTPFKPTSSRSHRHISTRPTITASQDTPSIHLTLPSLTTLFCCPFLCSPTPYPPSSSPRSLSFSVDLGGGMDGAALQQVDNSSGDVEEAMRRFVPHSISACVDSGQSPKEAEECRRVTIMFIRILDIECEPFNYAKPETPLLIQKCILEIYSVLHRYEGTVSRFQIDDKGTVLKIVFGFPLMAHEDDPVRAVHAAIEIRRNLKAGHNVQSCIGIATGWTICGLVGNDVRLEYTAVGSSVILAARLMQNANCCVLVNEDTYKTSCGSAVFEKICSIKVKGRDDKIKVYRPVESERRITKKLASVRDSEGILGRDTIIEELRVTFQEYLEQRERLGTKSPGRLVVLSGQAGIGKATVLRRFLGLMSDNHSVRIVKSSADAVETKTPYYPWKKIFAGLLGVDSNNKATQFTTRACENALVNLLEDKYEQHSVLNDILPTMFPEEKGENKLSAIDRRTKLHDTLALILNAVCAKSPMCIVIHACQFCDNSSMGLLRSLIARCPAVMAVITTRSDSGFSELQDLESNDLVMRHWPLPPLSPELSVQLVKQTLGQGQLDQAVADVVMDRTQGIPLYCVEFARLVKESPSGALSELPDTITGAVLLRIDRLLPAPKLILKIVAVAGRDVRASLIYDVVPSQFSGEDLQSELEYLVSVDILMRDRNGYCFRHEMVQEVVLGFLTFSQKRFLHKRIANFYVNSESEVSAATLAAHFELAAQGMDVSEMDVPACKRAIWFLKVAAEEAMKANAIEDANRYLSRCHDLMQMMPSSSDPFDLEMALGLVDGNEALLRQVVDQFRFNTEISIAKIEKAVFDDPSSDPLNLASPRGNSNGAVDSKASAWDEARFEARSIASAASTLGAEGLSHSALALENAIVDHAQGSSKDKVLAAITKLKTDFIQVIEFINSNTGSTTATTIVAGTCHTISPPCPSSSASTLRYRPVCWRLINCSPFARVMTSSHVISLDSMPAEDILGG